MAAKKNKDSGGKLNEVMVPYLKTPVLKAGLFFNSSLSQMTGFEKIDIIRNGVSKKELEEIKETAALDYDQLAQALSVTRATLINKKGKEKFGTALSERIVSVADIYAYGYEVFEDEVAFNRWILKPNRALGGMVPFDLLDTQYGREEVREVIGRIDYGLFS